MFTLPLYLYKCYICNIENLCYEFLSIMHTAIIIRLSYKLVWLRRKCFHIPKLLLNNKRPGNLILIIPLSTGTWKPLKKYMKQIYCPNPRYHTKLKLAPNENPIGCLLVYSRRYTLRAIDSNRTITTKVYCE